MKKKKKGLLTKELKAKLRNSRDDREILENLAVASKELDSDDLYFITGGAQYETQTTDLGVLKDIGSNMSEATKDAITALINSNSNIFVPGDNGQDLEGATFAKVESGNVAVLSEDGNGMAIPVGIHDGDPAGADTNRDNGEGPHVLVGIHDGNLAGADINPDNVEGQHVYTGDGVDSFQMERVMPAQIHSGAGDLTFDLDQAAQENAEISVDAGDGFDVMTLFGNAVKHHFTFENGKIQLK